MSRQRISRRDFLKRTTAGTAAAIAIPTIIPASARGADGSVAPSERITIGMIGVGDHGTKMDLQGFLHQDAAQVVAVCDVDRTLIDRAVALVAETYSARAPSGAFKGLFITQDWRELVARNDIDAVGVATPDHWHVLCSLAAMRAGKDVLCEKPLSLTVREGRVLANEAKRLNKITITASENRSKTNFLKMCELVRNGRIGNLKHIRVELPGGRWVRDMGIGLSQEPAPPPATLDWIMWQGQVAHAPYSPGRLHFNWRWLSDYSGGMLTDWGAHMLDIAQWGHGTDLTGPISVEGPGAFPADGYYNTVSTWKLTYTYADGVTLFCTNREPNEVTPGFALVRFEGADGWIECDWLAIRASNDALLNDPLPENAIRLRTCPEAEHRDFLNCVKSRKPTYAPFEVGHRTITISHLGNICMKLGRKLAWDPEKEQFVNDTEANSMLSREMHNGWSLDA
jgi:predicted dehydrogenase